MKRSTCNRRELLRRAAAVAAAPYAITSSALGSQDKPAASDRITVGFIGVGAQGIGQNLKMFLAQPDAEPVALCDADSRQIDKALKVAREKRGGSFSCQTTQDWREVVARDDIDAVMISTTDHWHVPIALAAIRTGKDVICEKPTFTLHEGRVLADAVKRYGTVFQFATEDRSLPIYHRMAELVRNGRIGKLQRIHAGLPARPRVPGDPKPIPVPPELDWQMWLGPAPDAPFRDRLHPGHWRWVHDYSAGVLADWGAHLFDTAQWAADTERTGPIEIEGTGQRFENGYYDAFHHFDLTYKYASGVELHATAGRIFLRFEGTDGWLGNDGWNTRIQASSPEILNNPIGPNETHLFTCPQGEQRNFLDCVKSRRDPYFPAEIGHRCCSLAHLGNIAMELGRKLHWDPEAETFQNDDTANRMRSKAMREPWSL